MQRVALRALQPVPVHAVVGLGVPDQLDRLAALQPSGSLSNAHPCLSGFGLAPRTGYNSSQRTLTDGIKWPSRVEQHSSLVVGMLPFGGACCSQNSELGSTGRLWPRAAHQAGACANATYCPTAGRSYLQALPRTRMARTTAPGSAHTRHLSAAHSLPSAVRACEPSPCPTVPAFCTRYGAVPHARSGKSFMSTCHPRPAIAPVPLSSGAPQDAGPARRGR